MKQKLIQQGAEAKIFLEEKVIIKDRIAKTYRHPYLDKKIRTRRTRSEAKILGRAIELGINVPKVLNVDEFQIQMQFVKGDKLSDKLNSYDEKKQSLIMNELGKQIYLLHRNNLIHGDITTSNIILQKNKVFIIDFGLGFFSGKIEDKAVDLHLLKQALEAKHFQNHEKLFKHFVHGYVLNSDDEEARRVIDRLVIVEKRGRYKRSKPKS